MFHLSNVCVEMTKDGRISLHWKWLFVKQIGGNCQKEIDSLCGKGYEEKDGGSRCVCV